MGGARGILGGLIRVSVAMAILWAVASPIADQAQTAGEQLDGFIPLRLASNPPDRVDVNQSAGVSPNDPRFFAETGFAVDAGLFDYFKARGGARTFGPPISNRFTLLGQDVQMFKKHVLKARADGTAETMELLGSEILPTLRFDGRVFPNLDPSLQNNAPLPGSSDYAARALAFIRTNAPDNWDGLPVGFTSAFLGTVTFPEAYPSGAGDVALLPLFAMEVLGLPDSQPTHDAANQDVVYLRWQRGVMEYNKQTGRVSMVSLGEYAKAVITGQGLPLDLAGIAQTSRYFMQYDPRAPGSVARPADLPSTSMLDAFQLSTQPQSKPQVQPVAQSQPQNQVQQSTGNQFGTGFPPVATNQQGGSANQSGAAPNINPAVQTAQALQTMQALAAAQRAAQTGQTLPQQPPQTGVQQPPPGFTGGTLPQTGQVLTQSGQTLPHTGQPLPQTGAQTLPQTGQTLPQTGAQTLPAAAPVGADPCYGDETISFSPESPRAGNELLMVVSSARPHPYGRLAGTEKTQFVRERPGQLGLVWEWTVQLTYPGDQEYTFYVDSTIPCKRIKFGVNGVLGTATPTPSKTPTPFKFNNNNGNFSNGNGNSGNKNNNRNDNNSSNGVPLITSGPTQSNTTTTASFNWTTDRLSDTLVECSEDQDKLSNSKAPKREGSTNKVTSHNVTVNNLLQNRTYFCRISSATTDNKNDAVYRDMNPFSTGAAATPAPTNTPGSTSGGGAGR